MKSTLSGRLLVAVVALSALGFPSAVQAGPSDVLPSNPQQMGVQVGHLGCFPLPGLLVSTDPQLEVSVHDNPVLTATFIAPTFTGDPGAALCVGVTDASFTGRVKFDVLVKSGTTVLGSYQLTLYIGVPVVPDYLPPNPDPIGVQPGEEGCFPVPGLLMATPAEIKVDIPPDATFTPVASPPTLDGSADAEFCVMVKDKDFTGLATFFYSLRGAGTPEYHTWTLQLYVGVPVPAIPATGSHTDQLAFVASVLLMAGVALSVVSRRRLT